MRPDETQARLLNRFGVRFRRTRTPLPIEVSNIGRLQLAEIFGELGFREGAEIGVLFGEYSEQLCRANPGLHLRCVDPWRASRSFHDMRMMSQAQFDGWEAEARRRLAPFACEILKATSVEAAARIPDRSLDFVYIDADHGFLPLVHDLAAWTPKVKVGGILAGHDYARIHHPRPYRYQGAPGHKVKAVVHAWAEAYSIKPWFVLGLKAVVSGQIRDKQRSWCWVVE